MAALTGLRKQTLEDSSAEGVAAVWSRYKETGCPQSRQGLVLHFAGLVRYVVSQVGADLPASVDFDDLVQAGAIGLMDAVDKFEPERGLKFETYAVLRVRGAVLDSLRGEDWAPRSVRAKARALAEAQSTLEAALQRTPTDLELAEALDVKPADLARLRGQLHRGRFAALDELLAEAGDGERPTLAEMLTDRLAADVDSRLLDAELHAALRRALGSLPDRDRQILVLSFVEQLTLRQIGAALSVTESRVCQLRSRALRSLRQRLHEEWAA